MVVYDTKRYCNIKVMCKIYSVRSFLAREDTSAKHTFRACNKEALSASNIIIVITNRVLKRTQKKVPEYRACWYRVLLWARLDKKEVSQIHSQYLSYEPNICIYQSNRSYFTECSCVKTQCAQMSDLNPESASDLAFTTRLKKKLFPLLYSCSVSECTVMSKHLLTNSFSAIPAR